MDTLQTIQHSAFTGTALVSHLFSVYLWLWWRNNYLAGRLCWNRGYRWCCWCRSWRQCIPKGRISGWRISAWSIPQVLVPEGRFPASVFPTGWLISVWLSPVYHSCYSEADTATPDREDLSRRFTSTLVDCLACNRLFHPLLDLVCPQNGLVCHTHDHRPEVRDVLARTRPFKKNRAQMTSKQTNSL